MSSGGTYNRGRTGMPRPPGSGRRNNLGTNTTGFNFRIGTEELASWRALAKEQGMSLGEVLRGAMRDYIEGDL